MARANKQGHDCILSYLGSTRFQRDENSSYSTWLVMPDMPLGDMVAWLQLPNAGPRGDYDTCHNMVRSAIGSRCRAITY